METTLAAWPNFDSFVGFDLRTPCGGNMLRFAPWFHLIAVRDVELIQCDTKNSKNVPSDIPSVVTISWDQHSDMAIPAHQIQRRREEYLDETHTVLVCIAYLGQHRAPFEVPATTELSFHVLYTTPSSRCRITTSWVNLIHFRGAVLLLPGRKPCAPLTTRAESRNLSWRLYSNFVQSFIRYEWR